MTFRLKSRLAVEDQQMAHVRQVLPQQETLYRDRFGPH
ncbi:MAG: hypothetical protein JW384_02685 [Nitrosomonadaceae bacterium]|nr:hypothetical protein [Nitrosomonadaceae bacterium]